MTARPKFRPIRELYQELYDHTPTRTSVTRWQAQGLKAVRIANKVCCTEEALRAFVEGGERIAPPSIEKQRSEAATAKALAESEKFFAAERI